MVKIFSKNLKIKFIIVFLFVFFFLSVSTFVTAEPEKFVCDKGARIKTIEYTFSGSKSIDENAKKKLCEMSRILDKKLIIVSAYREKSEVSDSLHGQGKAFDISIGDQGKVYYEAARDAHFSGFGFGKKYYSCRYWG